MDIEMLREFICFSRYMNVTKAAKELHMAPSSLSRHIAFMEKELGSPLISKADKKLLMTAAGSMLLNSASNIVAEYDDLMGQINQMTDEDVSDIFINYALDDRAIIENISLAYSSFANGIKGATVRTSSMTGNNIKKAFKDGSLDIAILYEIVDLEPEQFTIVPLFEDEIEVILPLSSNPDSLPRSPADLTDYFIPWPAGAKDNYLERCMRLFDDCEHKPSVRWVNTSSMDEFFMRPLRPNEMWPASKRQFTTYASSVPLCFRSTTNRHKLIGCETKLMRYAVYPKQPVNPATPEFVKAMQAVARQLPA